MIETVHCGGCDRPVVLGYDDDEDLALTCKCHTEPLAEENWRNEPASFEDFVKTIPEWDTPPYRIDGEAQ